ncbi:glycerophosphodiester phosphodiesterase family protein [Intrasporangium oryzae]|nr:glycerophosphodiester phosphodiesterase family protein [Intrasporangium oryzae]
MGLVPENTLEGFLAAIRLGVSGLELDVRLSGDGTVVVWHDPVLLDGRCVPTEEDLIGARVDDLTVRQLRTIDIGSLVRPDLPDQRAVPGARIVTLSELLEACADADVWWTIELKSNPLDAREVDRRRSFVDSVLAVIHAAGIERRCFVHSFDWAVLEVSHELAPDVLRSALADVGDTFAAGSPWLGSVPWEDHGGDLAGAVARLGAHVVSPDHRSVDAALVDRAHTLGLGVLPWTVNEPADVRRVVDAGADGLVTDYPDRVLALTRHGRT